MNSPDIQTTNASQSYWDIRKTLKPVLVIASIGIALGAAASYFLAANEETSMEASNYAVIPAPSSGAVSMVQDAAQGALVVTHGFMGLAAAAWVNKTAQNPHIDHEENIEHRFPVSVTQPNTPMTSDDLLKEIQILILAKTGTEKQILRLLQSQTTIKLKNDEKIAIIDWIAIKNYKPNFVKTVVKTLDPVFNDSGFQWLKKLNAYESPSLFRAICERYKVTDTQKLHDFISQEIRMLKHLKTDPDLYQPYKKTTLILIEIHGKKIINERKFFECIKKPEGFFNADGFLDLDFYKSLHHLGWKSHFFNLPINGNDQTLIHKFFRTGDVEFIKKLGEEIPLESMRLGDYLLFEELEECFEERTVETSTIEQEGNVFAQNGCRTIILTKSGQVLALPGQDVKTFLPPDSQPTVTFYLNGGHASIAFADGSHYGFYPTERDPNGHPEGFLTPSFWKSSAASTPKKPLPLITSIFFGSSASPLLSAYCTIAPDATQKTISEKYNELKLDIYASKDQVLAMKEYVKKIKRDCENDEAFYHLFSYNCIDFAQGVIASAGIEADVRNAFSQTELFRRPALGNLYTIIRSRDPILLPNDAPTENIGAAIEGAIPLALVAGTASAIYVTSYAIRRISQGALSATAYMLRATGRMACRLTYKPPIV